MEKLHDFDEKYLSCYVPLTNEIHFNLNLRLLLEILDKKSVVITRFLVCDVISFGINLNGFIMTEAVII